MMTPMKRKEFNGLQWLEFDLLSGIQGLAHAVFLRKGGTSQQNYSSLNFGYSVGDKVEDVDANFQIALEAFSKSNNNVFSSPFITSRQCHGADVFPVTSENKDSLPICDGLSTAELGLPLLMKHADCQVAIMYDPKTHSVANVHSGWRGSVQNIYGKAIAHMKSVYRSRPEDLLVCIGPSLGPESAQFIHFDQELPESFWKYQLKPSYFDFWAISHSQLSACGVLSKNMEFARIDTFTQSQDCFSYRRDKPTGRNATAVALINATTL